MRYKNWLILLVAGVSASALSACSISNGYSDSEKDMVATMTPSKYQPATRQMRTSIETQDLLAQAAFWSREYQLNPADLEAAVKLASSVRKMGNASRAAEITQTTRAMYPDDPYLIAEHSAALIALEKGKDAIKPLDKALHAAPGYARLWSLKGAALDQIGQYDTARQHYGRALKITPNDPNIMANMGLSFALAGDPRTAENWLRRAAGHPDAGDGIKQNLDLVLQLQGKPAQFAGAQASSPNTTTSHSQPAARSSSPYGVQQPQARGSYTPPAQPRMPQYGSPMSQPAHIGHRSSMAVTGNQPGAPRSAADMARAAASKSAQSRVVVPHQPTAQPQGDILQLMSNSLNRKQAAGQTMQPRTAYPQTAPRQQQVRPPIQGMPYPGAQQQSMPQGQVAPPQGYPGYMPYEGAPQRRRAVRRR